MDTRTRTRTRTALRITLLQAKQARLNNELHTAYARFALRDTSPAEHTRQVCRIDRHRAAVAQKRAKLEASMH